MQTKERGPFAAFDLRSAWLLQAVRTMHVHWYRTRGMSFWLNGLIIRIIFLAAAGLEKYEKSMAGDLVSARVLGFQLVSSWLINCACNDVCVY